VYICDTVDLLLHVSLVYTFYIFFIFRTQVYHEQKALLEGQRIEINKLLSFLKSTIQELPIGIIQADDASKNIIYFNTWVKSRFKEPSILNNLLNVNENSQEQIQKYESKLYSLVKKVDVSVSYSKALSLMRRYFKRSAPTSPFLS
jgi:c-di-AMP phosphodiesterase-like protein